MVKLYKKMESTLETIGAYGCFCACPQCDCSTPCDLGGSSILNSAQSSSIYSSESGSKADAYSSTGNVT